MKTIAVISGGNSPEHTISHVSAKYILDNIDTTRYKVMWLVASTSHRWFMVPMEHWDRMKDVGSGEKLHEISWSHQSIICQGYRIHLDAAFPTMHGQFGEDGHLQGFLSMLSIPYAGSGVLGSVVCSHKHLMKQVLVSNDIPFLPYLALSDASMSFKAACRELSSDVLFVKPSMAGSSYGTSKVENEASWDEALKESWKYDSMALIEPYVEAREIECAIWLDQTLSPIFGEIKTTSGYYDYDTKYVHTSNAELIAPADMDEEEAAELHALAIKACQVSGVKQYARVDFFKTKDAVYINEINALPGLTAISMFPRLLALNGYDGKTWIDMMLSSIMGS